MSAAGFFHGAHLLDELENGMVELVEGLHAGNDVVIVIFHERNKLLRVARRLWEI